MAIWSISPHDDVVPPYENSDGKFKFLPTATPGKAYTISYQNGNKIKSITYTIPNPYPCSLCDCEDIIFNQGQIEYPVDASTRYSEDGWIVIGTLDFKDDSNCEGKIGVSGNTNKYNDFDVRITGNNVEAKFGYFSQTSTQNGRILEYIFTINGSPCEDKPPYEIHQQAFRGTDNGVDTYADGHEMSYPIILPGYREDEYSTACSSYDITVICRDYARDCSEECTDIHCTSGPVLHGANYDEDSIVCEGGAYFQNPNGTYTKIDNDFTGITLDNWLRVDASCDNNVCKSGICEVGMVRVTALEEWELGTDVLPFRSMKFKEAVKRNIVRKIRFILSSSNHPETAEAVRIKEAGLPGTGGCWYISPETGQPTAINPEHAGEICALTWKYDVYQIPKGYYICYYENGNMDADDCLLLALNEECECGKKKKGECRCED